MEEEEEEERQEHAASGEEWSGDDFYDEDEYGGDDAISEMWLEEHIDMAETESSDVGCIAEDEPGDEGAARLEAVNAWFWLNLIWDRFPAELKAYVFSFFDTTTMVRLIQHDPSYLCFIPRPRVEKLFGPHNYSTTTHVLLRKRRIYRLGVWMDAMSDAQLFGMGRWLENWSEEYAWAHKWDKRREPMEWQLGVILPRVLKAVPFPSDLATEWMGKLSDGRYARLLLQCFCTALARHMSAERIIYCLHLAIHAVTHMEHARKRRESLESMVRYMAAPAQELPE